MQGLKKNEAAKLIILVLLGKKLGVEEQDEK